ncbi:unnamed protein product [Lampetra planeri]
MGATGEEVEGMSAVAAPPRADEAASPQRAVERCVASDPLDVPSRRGSPLSRSPRTRRQRRLRPEQRAGWGGPSKKICGGGGGGRVEGWETRNVENGGAQTEHLAAFHLPTNKPRAPGAARRVSSQAAAAARS